MITMIYVLLSAHVVFACVTSFAAFVSSCAAKWTFEQHSAGQFALIFTAAAVVGIDLAQELVVVQGWSYPPEVCFMMIVGVR